MIKKLGLVFTLCCLVFYLVFLTKDNDQHIAVNSPTEVVIKSPLIEANDDKKIIVSEISVIDHFDFNEINENEKLLDIMVQYIAEFGNKSYSNILNYHNVITLCNGIPNSGVEFSDWLVKHGNDEDLDVNHMHELIRECEGIESVSYSEQESLYRQAIDSGEEKAQLALAKLMPFHSEEKVDLLMNTIFYSDDSVELLAEIALQRDEKFMNDFHRYFWLSISDFGTISSDEFENLSNDFFSRNSMENMDKVKKIVNQWEKGNTSEKKRLLLELSEINAE